MGGTCHEDGLQKNSQGCTQVDSTWEEGKGQTKDYLEEKYGGRAEGDGDDMG